MNELQVFFQYNFVFHHNYKYVYNSFNNRLYIVVPVTFNASEEQCHTSLASIRISYAIEIIAIKNQPGL